jgi:shikimate dehydrogenase
MSHAERFLLAGLMGWPVMHSRSPILHNYWLSKYGLSGSYLPLAIEPKGLAAALRALPALGFSGCNLTIPHKEAALALVDHVDPLARKIGAINCVIVRKDGSLEGRNTDGWGYIESIRETFPQWRADQGPIVILGAGGAARAILANLIDQGAKEIRLINRSQDRALALAQEFGPIIQVQDWQMRQEALAGAALLINTTSQGMQGQPALDLGLDLLPASALVSDIVYIPRLTPLLIAAQLRGNAIVPGLGMLLHQARPSFEAWFGILPDVTPDLRARIEATL